MSRAQAVIVGFMIVGLLLGGLAFEIVTTRPVREAVHACAELFTIANRPGLSDEDRLSAARALCSARYLKTHQLALAAEGIEGLPRSIKMNFKAWRHGPDVWICTGNRMGPVYQFVYEAGRWRFDGLVAYLDGWGKISPPSAFSEQPQ
jgi:hypothetical protein